MNKASHTIGWTDFTWNPITGCLNTCPYCYARRIYKRFKKSFHPQIHPIRLAEPLGRKPSRIFVCSVSDFWGDGVQQAWREKVYDVIGYCPQHTFQILTKKPENITGLDILHCPKNVWIGVTNTGGTFIGTHDLMNCGLDNPFFISYEPLLKPMVGFLSVTIGWIIIGAQTQPYKPPETEWVVDIITEARSVGAKIYMKNNLKPIWDGKLIQEMPI
jgi:protein gp37